MTTGERVKELREKLKMTQTDLAVKLGYADKTVISKIENGKHNIPLARLQAYAEALCTSGSYLLGETDDSEDLWHQPIEEQELVLTDDEKELIWTLRSLPDQDFQHCYEYARFKFWEMTHEES